jgi:hypothetical protein
MIFESFNDQWANQLRMPLIQEAIARHYGRPAGEVWVGFHNLDGNLFAETRYGEARRKSALTEFGMIGTQVTNYWPTAI